MYDSQTVVERIRNISKRKDIPIGLLNSRCNLSENTISQSGKSESGMKAKNLYMIAEFLDVSVDYLLGRTDEPNGNLIKSQDIDNINQKKLDKETMEIAEMIKNLSLIERSKVILFIEQISKQKKEEEALQPQHEIRLSQSPKRAIARSKENPIYEAPTPEQRASLTPVPEDSGL